MPEGPTTPDDARRVAQLLHDLRNPLAGVRGAIQIVRDRNPDSADHQILDEVLVRLDEMAAMIDATAGKHR